MNALFCLFLILNTIIWVVTVEYQFSEFWDDRDDNQEVEDRITELERRSGSDIYRYGIHPSRPAGIDSLANPRNRETPDITVAMQLEQERATRDVIQHDIRKRIVYFGALAVILALLIWGYIRVSWGFKFGEPFYLWKELHDVLFLPV